ncbi:MAG: STAS/SEC14 domain-containing protein [Arthrobacter sp.]
MAVKEELANGAAEDAQDGIGIPEGDLAEVTGYAGYVKITLPAGHVVTGPVAAQAAEEFGVLAECGARPLLLDVTGVEAITRGARSVFATARSVSAVAVLGASQVDRVIANFLLGGELPQCPTRYFSSTSEALEWLQSQKQ